MLNTALLASRNELNDFTQELAAECQRVGSRIVKVRNGMWFCVSFCAANRNGNDDPLFHTSDWEHCWEANGASVANRDFDIVEF